ncbi:MAG: hypothetical protein AAF787_07905 [Chloroflexota bacterium]
MGNKDKAQITVIWKNLYGEEIYVETLSANRVASIIQSDDRAFYNTFVLPTGESVDSVQFNTWYSTAPGAMQ